MRLAPPPSRRGVERDPSTHWAPRRGTKFAGFLAGSFLLALSGACGPSPPPSAPVQTSVVPQRPSGAAQSLAGEVLGVDRTPVEDQNNLTLRLKVTPGGDRTVSVDLGPGWTFDEQGLHFEPNEQLVVYGLHRIEEGHTTVVAEELEKGGTKYRRDPVTGRWQVIGEPLEPEPPPLPATPATPAP